MLSLSRTHIPQSVPIFVFDDCSDSRDTVIQHVETLKQAFPGQVTLEHRQERWGAEANMRDALKRLINETGADFVVLCNDDILYAVDWYWQLMAMVSRNKAFVGAATCFNTDTHGFNYMLNETEGVKHNIGGCCTAVRRDIIDLLWDRPLPPVLDHCFCDISRELAHLQVCTKTSFVEHIGGWGVNSRPDRYDVASTSAGAVTQACLHERIESSLRARVNQFDETYFINSEVSNYVDYLGKDRTALARDIIKAAELTDRAVLDFGCATGSLVDALGKQDVDAIGTDISWWAIRTGREKYGLDADHLQHYNRQLVENHDDVLVCLDVLEHIPSPEFEEVLSLFQAKVLVLRMPVSAEEGEDFVLEVSRKDKTHSQVHCKDWWLQLLETYGYNTHQVLEETTIYESDGVFARVMRRER